MSQIGFYNKNEPILKFYKKKGIYQNSTGSLTFNPIKMEAHSYSWWLFVAKIKRKIVFNNYRYSMSTTKQQMKIQNLLNQLDIKIDYYIEARRGLDRLDIAIEDYSYKIKTLEDLIAKPSTRANKNAERKALIKTYKEKIKIIKRLGGAK